jgi:low temperature requirement protein LtrA
MCAVADINHFDRTRISVAFYVLNHVFHMALMDVSLQAAFCITGTVKLFEIHVRYLIADDNY